VLDCQTLTVNLQTEVERTFMSHAVRHPISSPLEAAELLEKIRELMLAISRRSSTEKFGSDIFKQCQRTMVELGHLGIMITGGEMQDLESLSSSTP
jgi:hypothetical protein